MQFQNQELQKKNALIKNYLDTQVDQPKTSLCRFYLRGLCLFKPKQCKFSHGIDDLQYKRAPHNPNYKADWGNPLSPFNEKPLFRGELNYMNLYDIQTEKKYTLEEINNSKDIRTELRTILHRQEFQKFIQLLRRQYKGKIFFLEPFIEEEYYRIGFNKLMTRIKYGHLVEFLQYPQSLYFKVKKGDKTFYVQKQSQQESLAGFASLLENYIDQARPDRLIESQFKGWLYKNNTNLQLPPLSTFMKNKGLTFEPFAQKLLQLVDCNHNLHNLISADNIAVADVALQYLSENGRIVQWVSLTAFINQKLSINNMSVLESLEGVLKKEGIRTLKLQTGTFLFNSHSKQAIEESFLSALKCSCQAKINSKTEMQIQLSYRAENVSENKCSITVAADQESFKKALNILLSPKQTQMIAIDLEGRLRKPSKIEVIQIRTFSQIVILDLLSLNEELQAQLKAVLKPILQNPMIIKVFHDSRNDSLALHQIFECCIKNVIDTSALEFIRQQFDGQKYSSIKQPGLNDQLFKYGAPNGINESKQKIHGMMGDDKYHDYFVRRPIEKEYLQYCAKDVEDLLYIGIKISEGLPCDLRAYASQKYIESGYKSLCAEPKN